MKISLKGERIFPVLLALIFLLTFIYSFSLVVKKYQNYEYGKFDLGNMSQMIWMTSQGHFMEVTDQFGTNMPRWGMSHVDPVLLLFVPFYWIFAHPLIPVFFQHLLVLSAVYPLYKLMLRKVNSPLSAFLISLSYLLYPAIGYTLIWTTYHGISFVAPILIWLIYFLEANDFLRQANLKDSFIYWTLIILMLLGKEEVGFILALASVFLYFKNKRLALLTFLISFVWSALCFFVIIPSYSDLREQGINQFIQQANIKDAKPESVQGENFFLTRYEYLGSSYSEILINLIRNPSLITKVVFSDFNMRAVNYLLGPLAYFVILVPFWLITMPDLAILFLSKEEIFAIDNHRVAFIVVSLFICAVYGISYARRKFEYAPVVLASLILISSLYFSWKSENPLFVSGTSFVQEKIIRKVWAAPVVGASAKAQIPRNSKECLNKVVSMTESARVYSGPDYLGDHTSLRDVNALFPARTQDADTIIVDLFDEKALDRIGVSGWMANKSALMKLVSSGRYSHVYSCGMVFVFNNEINLNEPDTIIKTNFPGPTDRSNMHKLETKNISLEVENVHLPDEISLKTPAPILLGFIKNSGNFYDKVTFWEFKKAHGGSTTFLDYLTSGAETNLDNINPEQDYIIESYTPHFGDSFETGEYEVYYGVGDLVRASKVYLGSIKITK